MKEIAQMKGWLNLASEKVSYDADMASEVYHTYAEARRLRAIEDRLSKIYDLIVEIEDLGNDED